MPQHTLAATSSRNAIGHNYGSRHILEGGTLAYDARSLGHLGRKLQMHLHQRILWDNALATRLLACGLFALIGTASGASLQFVENAPDDYDYAQQLTLPAEFGEREFTLELWLRLDESYPVGSTETSSGQRLNWTDSNRSPYSSTEWWWRGNFLLDGHNNSDGFAGTFSLQLINGGRLRWLFGDSAAASRTGYLHAVQSSASATLLDAQWHQVTLVRRWGASSGAILEMWIDGLLIDTETTSARTDMAAVYWSSWTGFPQPGWLWGAEKLAALGGAPWEDYKGQLDELRFWSRAKSPSEIQNGWDDPVVGDEPGLVGRYAFDEAQGTSTCNALVPIQCMTLLPTSSQPNMWSTQGAPLGTGDTTLPTAPDRLTGTAVSATQIDLEWDSSTDNVAVALYRVRRDGVAIGTSTSTSFSDAALTAGTMYSYTVSALDTAGNESLPSAELEISTLPASGDAIAPSAPTNLRTTDAPTTAQVALVWDAAIDNIGIIDYQVLRNGTLLATVSATAHVDSTVSAGSTYSYTVVARDAAGNSSTPSAALSVTTPQAAPPPPPSSGGGGGGGGGGATQPWALLLLGLLAVVRRWHGKCPFTAHAIRTLTR